MPGTFGPLLIMVPNPGGNWPGAAKSWETACEAADEKGRHVRWPPSECRATGALLGCVPRRFQAHTPPLPLQTLPFCRARLYVLLFCVPQIFWAHPWRGPSHASRQKLHLQEWPHSAQRRAGSPAPCTRAVRTRVVAPVIYSLCDVATLRLNFPFEKKDILLFPSFPLTFLYTGQNRAIKRLVLSSLQKILFYTVGGILHIYLSGSNCFPVLDGYT